MGKARVHIAQHITSCDDTFGLKKVEIHFMSTTVFFYNYQCSFLDPSTLNILNKITLYLQTGLCLARAHECAERKSQNLH